MAVAQPTTPTNPTWHWRGELALVGTALRSIYPYLLAIVALLAVTLAYQVGTGAEVRVGGGYDAPYVRGFYEREANADNTARWRYASDRARVLLPGAGAQAATLVITADTRPDGVARPVQVVVNGIALGAFTPTPGLADYRFPLRSEQYSYGDLTIDLLSDPQLVAGKSGAPVPFGPRVAGVRTIAEAGAGVVRPPLRPLAAWFVLAPTLYFLLRRLGLRASVAGGVALAGVALGAWAIVAARLDLALLAPRLAGLLVAAYALLVLTDLVVPRLLARGGVAIAPREWRLLQLIALTALLLKLGGVLHPQLFIIDQPAQNQFFEKILRGRFMELYQPTAGSISSLPGQWGINAQLPYPPFFFVLGLPFYRWPFGTDLSINIWSVVLDGTRPLLVFFLARRLGASPRAGLLAAFVMGLTASTFLLHSWGNYPTTASQWFALLFIVLLVARFRDLRRPAVLSGLTLLLAATMLLYTVTAAFIGVFLVALFVALAWRGDATGRQQLAPLGRMLGGASVLAFVAYYAQYAGPLLTETLPAFGSKLGGGEALGVQAIPFPTYAANYVERLGRYGVLLSLLLVPLGLRPLLRSAAPDRLAGPILAAWFTVFGLFFLAGTKIDMVDKEVWFILPAVAICAGAACDSLLTRFARARPRTSVASTAPSAPVRSVTRLAHATLGLYLAHLTWVSLALWYFRIMVTRH